MAAFFAEAVCQCPPTPAPTPAGIMEVGRSLGKAYRLEGSGDFASNRFGVQIAGPHASISPTRNAWKFQLNGLYMYAPGADSEVNAFPATAYPMRDYKYTESVYAQKDQERFVREYAVCGIKEEGDAGTLKKFFYRSFVSLHGQENNYSSGMITITGDTVNVNWRVAWGRCGPHAHDVSGVNSPTGCNDPAFPPYLSNTWTPFLQYCEVGKDFGTTEACPEQRPVHDHISEAVLESWCKNGTWNPNPYSGRSCLDTETCEYGTTYGRFMYLPEASECVMEDYKFDNECPGADLRSFVFQGPDASYTPGPTAAPTGPPTGDGGAV